MYAVEAVLKNKNNNFFWQITTYKRNNLPVLEVCKLKIFCFSSVYDSLEFTTYEGPPYRKFFKKQLERLNYNYDYESNHIVPVHVWARCNYNS